VVKQQKFWLHLFFGEKTQTHFERFVVALSIIGFLVHLALIGAYHAGWLDFGQKAQEFLKSPISALYTPFSFILIFEVYLLVAQLPRSFTSSVQKQYEIIALILIRRIFKDISHLNLNGDWLQSVENYTLALDLGIFLFLFFLIYLFRRLRNQTKRVVNKKDYSGFINLKRWVSIALVPILLGLIIYEFGGWIFELNQFKAGLINELTDVNQIFYHDFFMILICVDVLVLLLSLNYIQNYNQLIRNSGYIVSTVLIRLSFTVEGVYNSLLILLGVIFGVALLAVFNLVEKAE
jgi:hypothetical protein